MFLDWPNKNIYENDGVVFKTSLSFFVILHITWNFSFYICIKWAIFSVVSIQYLCS